MNVKRKTGDNLWLVYAAFNFGLLAAAVAVGLVSFFASLEIVLTIGAGLIWQSLGDTVQGKYGLVALRNVWMILGGLLWLGVIIYSINYFFKHWRARRIHRVYLYLLGAAALIILLAQIVTAA